MAKYAVGDMFLDINGEVLLEIIDIYEDGWYEIKNVGTRTARVHPDVNKWGNHLRVNDIKEMHARSITKFFTPYTKGVYKMNCLNLSKVVRI